MKCPVCYHQDTKVIDSRLSGDGFCIRRRRECLKCGFRFSTYEEVELLGLTILKNDGRREAYSREKLIRGLSRALEKRPITEDGIKKLANAIERDIQKLRKSEVASREVGNIVMKHLKKTDKVAYIRFASVYQSFEDLEEFQAELNKLFSRRRKKK